jgi:hypothetical protein
MTKETVQKTMRHNQCCGSTSGSGSSFSPQYNSESGSREPNHYVRISADPDTDPGQTIKSQTVELLEEITLNGTNGSKNIHTKRKYKSFF